MKDKGTVACMLESDLDTIELGLRKAVDRFLAEGNVAAAEEVESKIGNLDRVPVCAEETDVTRGFSMMMRDRSRYL